MSTRIRPVEPGDLGWIIASHGALYAQEFHFDARFEVDIARKAVALCDRAAPFTRLWIAEVDGEKAGSIAVSQMGKGLAFINFLLVLPGYRGRGIARQLMQQALDHAAGHGLRRVRLETYSCLVGARRLYAAMGFRLAEPVKPLERYGQRFEQEFWALDLSQA